MLLTTMPAILEMFYTPLRAQTFLIFTAREIYTNTMLTNSVLPAHARRQFGLPGVITGDHSKQDQILLVKIGKYIGFCMDRRFYLLGPNVVAGDDTFRVSEGPNARSCPARGMA